MRAASRPNLTVYLTPDCHLCHDALVVLRGLQAELRFDIEERDITLDDALHRTYLERIPVVALGDEELFEYFVDPAILRKRLGSEQTCAGSDGRVPHPDCLGSPR